MGYYNVYAEDIGALGFHDTDTIVTNTTKLDAIRNAVEALEDYEIVRIQFEKGEYDFEFMKLNRRWDS